MSQSGDVQVPAIPPPPGPFVSEGQDPSARRSVKARDIEAEVGNKTGGSCSSQLQEWIIAGDFNSRHPLWGPEDEPETNQASTILELCADYQLHVLNRYPCPPTFTSVNGQSWIDLTLSSAELAGLTTWAVRNDLVSLSDHQIVETQIWRHADLPKDRTKQNWRKADWQAIQTSLKDALLDFPEASSWQALTKAEEFDSHSLAFATLIKEAAQPHVPLSGSSKPRKHWWNPELEQLHRTLKRALRCREKHKRRFGWTPALLEDTVQSAKTQLKQAIKQCKRLAWREFLEANSKTQTDLWTTVRRVTKAQSRPALDFVHDQNGTLRHDPTEIADALKMKFFPSPATRPTADMDSPLETLQAAPIEDAIPTVSEQEARQAFGNGRPLAAPGPDGIPTAFQKRCMHLLAPHLAEMATASLQLSACPRHWKHSQVIAIHKGSNPRNEVSKLRPISLLNTMAKGMEALVAARLKFWAEDRAVLDPFQFGFRPARSTVDAILTATDWIEEQNRRGNTVYGVAMDLVAAFDTIRRDYLVESLIQMGAPPYITRWCRAFLQHRTAELQIGGQRYLLETEAGVPQGSPLSPLLFILGVNAALQIPKEQGVHLQAYADDILLLCSATTEEQAQAKAQRALDYLADWSQTAGMKFSEQKCLAIRFHPKVTRISMLPIYLGTTQLQAVKSCRYLGLILDERRTWKPHLRHVQQRARERLEIIQRFSAKTWGFSPEAMWQLTTKALEPALYYGAEALGKAQDSPDHLLILNRVVRQAGLLITGCLRTTSYEAVFALAGLLPAQMEIRRRVLYEHLRKYKGETQQTRSDLLTEGDSEPGPLRRQMTARQWHRNLPNRLSIRLPNRHLCSYPPDQAGALESDGNEDSRTDWILAIAEAEQATSNGKRTAIVWKLKGRKEIAGSGVLVESHQSIKEEVLASIRAGLSSLSDLLQGEAQTQSLGIIARRKTYKQELTKPFNVSEDMHHIQQWWIRWRKDGNQVNWFTQAWSPGRSPYQAAKLSAEQLLTQQRRSTQLGSYTDLGWCKRHISFWLNSLTQDQLANGEKGRAILDLHPPMEKGHFPTRRLPRIDASRVNQFLANHFPSKAYLTRFHCREDDDATCVCGQGAEDRDHLLHTCPRFHRSRTVYEKDLQAEAEQNHPLWDAPRSLAIFLEEIAKEWKQQDRSWY